MKQSRPEKRLERGEYLSRARSMALRGQELPQTKLLEMDVVAIRSAARQRENLLKHISENLSNKALAKQHNVSVRAIEKVVQFETWIHIP